MTFPGFTLPDGAWLPGELIELLPQITTRAELAVTIAAIYQEMAVGGAEPTSITDFENLTGLARASVQSGIKHAEARGTLQRQRQGQSYTYRPRLNPNGRTMSESDIVEPVKVKRVSIEESSLIDDSLPDSLPQLCQKLTYSPEIGLLRELRAAGVYLKTAQALIKIASRDAIRQHLRHYAYALKAGLAQSPGWLVLSIKENWPAPLGYTDPDADPRAKYTSGEFAAYVISD